jgi:DNA polymerase-3 subunit epsilon/ATP-dependent DNA helicase DinG
MELSEGGDFPDQIQFTDELMQEIAILSDQFLHLNKFFEDRADHKEWIRWVSADLNGVVTVHLAPMLVGPHLSEKLYNTKKSIIFTSATLGVKLTQEGMDEIEQHPFTYVRRMLGLNEKFEELILDTPFNYESQAYVIIPTDLQPVQSSGHMSQISGFMKHLIKLVGGGLLGLFTSHSALESVYLSLVKEIPAKDTKILAQRISGGRAKIMKAYMANPQHSALLGTSSFWEGVDIQGDALTTLVIHKIPFDVPSDPVLKVRGQMFSNSFMEYSIPRAILRFRQGFGRMIRSVTDYGVMIVLDDRLLKKEYGQMFLQALPEGVTIEKMPLNEVPDRVHEWLELQKDQSTSH